MKYFDRYIDTEKELLEYRASIKQQLAEGSGVVSIESGGTKITLRDPVQVDEALGEIRRILKIINPKVYGRVRTRATPVYLAN